MRIAIIGTGISGLVAAHRLQHVHDITVFEAADRVGGHTHTIDVELDGERYAVDTGFIVFNEPNYPGFVGLLEELGVESQPSRMSFSVRCDRTGLEYNGSSLNGLFAQRRNLVRPRFLGMVWDILRFHREGRAALEECAIPPDRTVEEFVEERGYGLGFLEHYLVPLGSALWSCPPGAFRRFPMRFVLKFLMNHAMMQVGGRPVWRVIRGGSHRYVESLIEPFRDRIRLSTPVRALRRWFGGVAVRHDDGTEFFDHAVVGTHADQALAMLEDPTPRERELLSAFPYQANDAVLHTDAEAVLPRRRRAWSSWNARVEPGAPDRLAVTYNMNRLQSLESRHTFCVTLNEHERIEPSRILRRVRYHHPVYTDRQAAAQGRHRELINTNRTSFCGAYWGYGFHEDGVQSAERVCAALNAAGSDAASAPSPGGTGDNGRAKEAAV